MSSATTKQSRLPRLNVSLVATMGVCLLLYLLAGAKFHQFFTGKVFLDLLNENAYLGICAVGMTFVILSGGIDLSVGSMIGLTGIASAVMITNLGWHPLPTFLVMLLVGALFGAAHGALVRWFELPPFLVTLAGMFMARGLALVISQESVTVKHPWYSQVADARLPIGPGVAPPTIALLVVFAVAVYLGTYTKFGRNTYAVGGNENSALLMGLPCGATKVWVYVWSGFCSALAGVVHILALPGGDANAGMGLELDAIAAAVIGGTLLSGGVGHVGGTFFGLLILAVIQTAITFKGNLNSWWIKIAIGLLLLVFILLQRAIQRRAERK